MTDYFLRPALADELAGHVLGSGMFATRTLFLGAPRRTGKSAFLLRDFVPALERRGAATLYVDLSTDRKRDPSELIASTVAARVLEAQNLAMKAARKVGPTKISIRGSRFNLEQIGKAQGAGLADALASLCDRLKQPLVLIVDEVQHAITTNAGMVAMFALKSARDVMGADEANTLTLVMVGSDRDKLVRLVHGNRTPFLGTRIDALPLLDADYIGFVVQRLTATCPAVPIDAGRLQATFGRFNHRPEEFQHALNDLLGPFGAGHNGDFHALIDARADQYEQARARDYLGAYANLTPLQQAVLARILAHSSDTRLFTADALMEYGRAHGRKVLAGTARGAVERLRALEPPLVWKSERGDYDVQDGGMRRWYMDRVKRGAWPPDTDE